MKRLLLAILLFCAAMPIFPKNENTKLTATLLITYLADDIKAIKESLKEIGVKKAKTNLKAQTVEICFNADSLAVSDILNKLKEAGFVAIVAETGCFGSREGCLNAVHLLE